jgi:hypothetical protein
MTCLNPLLLLLLLLENKEKESCLHYVCLLRAWLTVLERVLQLDCYSCFTNS